MSEEHCWLFGSSTQLNLWSLVLSCDSGIGTHRNQGIKELLVLLDLMNDGEPSSQLRNFLAQVENALTAGWVGQRTHSGGRWLQQGLTNEPICLDPGLKQAVVSYCLLLVS